MAIDAESKRPMRFVVFEFDDDEVAYPPVAIEDAGGNKVTISNMITKPLTVYHGGNLDAADPFTVPARGSGGPPKVTCDLKVGSDQPGKSFTLKIEASTVRAFGGPGDPTIIIL